MSGVGRWEAILDPVANYWPGFFAVDNHVEISIDGVLMMRGYIDDIQPYLDVRGHHTDLYKFIGRDRGMDLAQHYITQEYTNTRADLLIANALGVIPSEITLALTGAVPPNIDYEFRRTYLGDGFRDIAKLINYDFYVDDTNWPANANLNFFDIGNVAEHTAVNLEDRVGFVGNNILRLKVGEAIGYEVKNYIEIHAGGVRDHWSDINADNPGAGIYGWQGAEVDGFTQVNNVIAPPPPYTPLRGKSVIEWERTTLGGGAGASTHSMYIDFAAVAGGPWTNVSDYYGYAGGSIDLSKRNDCHVMIRTDAGGYPILRPALVDNTLPNPNVIWFYSMYGNPLPPVDDDRVGYGPTDNLAFHPLYPNWFHLRFPVGDDLVIGAALAESRWSHTPAPAGPLPGSAGGVFNWNNIEQLWFVSVNNQNPCHYWIDDLTIPGIEARSIINSAASIGNYGQRMKEEFRNEIRTQVELNDYAVDTLAKYENPLETITATAYGQTGSVYAAQSLDVCAPDFGIGTVAPTYIVYRIYGLHHRVVKNSAESDVLGYTFLTEYNLVRNQISGVDQELAPSRLDRTLYPSDSLIEGLKRESRNYGRGQWARDH